ncbi:MAG: hypothetical protein JWN38_759 [Candidatus Saccharibacteria bacterium]|nr:hypothetical protein [Candidatus Saccharibacteria bacterium]
MKNGISLVAARRAEPGEGQIDIITAQFSEPGMASVDLQEQARFLAETTVHFDTVAQSAPFLRAAANPTVATGLERRYGKNAANVINGFQARHDEALAAARESFASGFGRYALLDSGLIEADQLDDFIAPEFERFQAQFQGETRATKREAYRYYLADRLEAEAKPQQITDPEVPPRVISLTGRVTLAHMLRPEFIGKSREEVAMVGPEQARAYTPQRLHGALFGQTRRDHNAIPYVLDGESRRRYVTLTQSEWKIVMRATPEYVAQTGINDTINKLRHPDAATTGDQLDEDAPRRSGVHTVERYHDGMQAYHDEVLQPSIGLIDRFLEASRYGGGLARFGNEANARQSLNMLQTFVLGDMYWAVAGQDVYSPLRTARNIEKATEFAIYAPPEPRVRLKNFQALLGLARTWYGARSDLYSGRIHQANAYLAHHMNEDERAARTA